MSLQDKLYKNFNFWVYSGVSVTFCSCEDVEGSFFDLDGLVYFRETDIEVVIEIAFCQIPVAFAFFKDFLDDICSKRELENIILNLLNIFTELARASTDSCALT